MTFSEKEAAFKKATRKREYRSRVVILYQMLKNVKSNKEGGNTHYNFVSGNNYRSGATKIKYKIETSNPQFVRYMKFLEDTKLVQKVEYIEGEHIKKKGKYKKKRPTQYYYEITNNGQLFLDYVEQLIELVDDKNGFLFPTRVLEQEDYEESNGMIPSYAR